MEQNLKYKQYEKLGPFEIKDFLAKVATKAAQESSLTYLNAGRGNPNWVATEPREAFFLLGQFAVTREQARARPAAGRRRHAEGGRASPARLEAWLTKHEDMPGAPFLQRMVPWAVKKFGFDADKFVHELVGFDHRRPLPGAGPHAGAQRTDRPRVPAVGDVRQPASEGHVQDLRGRGRHRRHVLHLQVAEEQPHPQPGRHDRARRADLHAVPRDGAPRGLRPPLRRDAREAGEQVPVPGRGAREAPRSEDQGVLHRQPGQPLRGGDVDRPPSRRSARCSRSGPI